MANTPEYLDNLSLYNAKLFQDAQTFADQEILKTIFLLSTGTLVLSVSFIGYLHTDFIHPWILITAWFFLGLAIVGNITLNWLTAMIENRKLEHVNQSRSDGHTPDWITRMQDDTELITWSDWAFSIRRWTVVSLAIGLFALLYFGAINLLHQYDLNQIHNQQIRNSITSPLLPNTGFQPH